MAAKFIFAILANSFLLTIYTPLIQPADPIHEHKHELLICASDGLALCSYRVELVTHTLTRPTMMSLTNDLSLFSVQNDPILDPLSVLRCDRRIFHVAPLLEIILYILKACLAASRVQLQQHIQENPILERNQVCN